MRDRWPFIENHDRDERRSNDAEKFLAFLISPIFLQTICPSCWDGGGSQESDRSSCMK